MTNKLLALDDTSMTHLSPHAFDRHDLDQQPVEQLVRLLNRNDALPQMRQHIALPANNHHARKRVLAMAESTAFVAAWEQSVQPALIPTVRAIWTAWRQQRATDRERMRRLRHVFRAVNQLRDCFPVEVAHQRTR